MRKRWIQKGSSNYKVERKLKQRVSIICAMSSEGNDLFALTKRNTNSQIFTLFMEELIKGLEIRHEIWRKKVLILLDNASYHNSAATREYLAARRVPVIYSGSYSFDSAPIEKLIALLK